MKATTLSMSRGSITMLGMVGCEVVSQTVSAGAVNPLVLATFPKGGAVGSGESSRRFKAWHLVQNFFAYSAPAAGSPACCANAGSTAAKRTEANMKAMRAFKVFPPSIGRIALLQGPFGHL